MIAFKTGAFCTGDPVQPVIIKYPWEHYDPSWVGEVTMLPLLFHSSCQFINRMTVRWLPVYYPSEQERNDPYLYANNVRMYMSKESGLPLTNHTYDDAILQLEAFKYHLAPETVGFEVQTLSSLLKNVNLDQMKQYLADFAAVADKRTQTITIDQFASTLGLPISPPVRFLFNLIDTDGHGALNFKEWLVGLAFLNNHQQDMEESVKFAFHVFDPEDRGYITPDDFDSMFKRINPSTWTPELSKKIFDQIDSSHKNRIDFPDFLNFMKSHPLAASLLNLWTSKSHVDLFNFSPPTPTPSSSHID